MAAVASGRLSESFRGPEVEQATESGPGFTAVNGGVNGGRSPATSSNTMVAVEPHREPIEEPRNRDMHTNGPLARKDSPTTPNPPINRAPSRQEASEESRQNSNHSRASSSHQTHTTNTSPQSRKRSFTEYHDDAKNSSYHNHGFPKDTDRHRGYHEGEDRKEEARIQHVQQRPDNGRISPKEPPYQQATGNVYRAHQPPPDMQSQNMELREHEHRPEYERPPEYRRQSMYDRQHTRPEYEAPPDPSSQPNRPYYNPHTDESFAAALQRETRDYESAAPENFASPDDFQDDDEEHGGQGYGDYSGNRGSQSGVERDMKRRKRVFSNRTKTGCMTCRRRKKKCDEQHPECNNCLRGGFVCEGYSMRNTWQKPPNVKPPMPIQSKNGYADVMSRPPQGQPRYGQDIHHEYGHGPLRQPHSMPSDGDRVKPIMVDDERYPPPSSGPESHNAHLRPKWETPPRQPPSNSQYNTRYQSEPDHRPASSAYENPHAQQTPEPQTLHVPPSAQRNNSSQYVPQASSSHPPHNAPAVAQAALHQHATLAPRPPPPQQVPLPRRPSPPPRVEMTERQKMLKGDYYFPYSPALIEDREKCLANLWRFNNATSPASGISIEERPRLFKAILHNRPAPEPPGGDVGSSNMPPPSGSVGENVIVEAPFYCDYGYNINIGDDVLIGPDCRISDSCTVTIGARCIFSPNVKLVCATYPIDPRKRLGSRGQALARNITIEEDCWIGSDVTITAGVRIGKSSTIGAGSLVHQNVPRFTVVAGNPAKVQRGIYNDETGL